MKILESVLGSARFRDVAGVRPVIDDQQGARKPGEVPSNDKHYAPKARRLRVVSSYLLKSIECEVLP